MRFQRPGLLSCLIFLCASVLPNLRQAESASNLREPQPANAFPAGSVNVYVSDFDLDVAYRKPSAKPATRTSPPPRPGGVSRSASGVPRKGPSASPSGSPTSQSPDSSNASAEETPADRANALVNAMSENLIRALTQAGYNASRLPAGASLPKTGLRIRGVFAEADERNRARRLLVGGEAVSPNMILFVGVNNLARPEQPLYELANPLVNDSRHGPVITVTSYVPASRFELARDPSDDELRNIATKIAADLTALLNANPSYRAQ